MRRMWFIATLLPGTACSVRTRWVKNYNFINKLTLISHQVKIADFGLARELGNNEKAIKLRKDQRLPIKWLAPETMIERACTKKSDVWSFGVLCWEIYANGESPYAGVGSNNIVAKKVCDLPKNLWDLFHFCRL